MHHKCTARHLKRARLARGSLDSADSAISFVCEERYPVTIAVGKHLFPSRTQQLSPPAPMVLPWQRGGRVGRCRVSLFFVFQSGNALSGSGAVVEVDHTAGEAAFLQQYEVQVDAIGEGALAAADHHRRDEQLILVD